ncbi:MAG: DUF4105 domain-containing protein [Hyphomonadaceae bacterium]|nr:DUF4105 domain-containing protein [Hyphomonadaceae bacterium]
MTQTARTHRNWVEHLAVMPAIEMHEDGFALEPATDWTYDANGPTAKNTVSFAASYADLRNVWFMVEPQPGQPYAAHTLVLFEFTDDRIIGLTVEARREEGEDYDAVAGFFNKFELAYIWSTSKELLARRAVFLNKDIYVYPLALTDQQKTDFLKALLGKTIDVDKRPRFYNTATSNCTNELAKTAALEWHYSWVLTGYAPRRLYDTKLIPGESFEKAKETASMGDFIRAQNGLSSREFDRAMLAELRKRQST